MPRHTIPTQKGKWTPDTIICLKADNSESMGLLQFLLARLSDRKRSDVKSLLAHEQIRLNGRMTRQFDEEVRSGDIVEVNLSRAFVVFRHPRMQIIYEDDDLIVVNKGYGLLSVGTGSTKKEETAYEILKRYVKNINPGNKIFVIHRLDRATSGLMMFAKSAEIQQKLQHNWKNMVRSRLYVAVLEGLLSPDSGEVRSNLAETSQYEVYETNREFGKPAVTRYKVLAKGKGRSLVEFSLDTGRKNQIRIHARSLGHPIVGDRKYGASTSPINRMALHATTLRFVHPRTRKIHDFELPIPERFMTLVRTR